MDGPLVAIYVNQPMKGSMGSQDAGRGKGYPNDGQWPAAPGTDDGASDGWSMISEVNEQ